MTKVSVIIPIYNGQEYIQACLESIQKQTLKDFEVILINDGSKDNSGELCKSISREDRRFKVYHQLNKGVSEARNLGIKKAKGSYITFIDIDDRIPINYLEILYSLAIQEKKKVVMCPIVSIKENNEIISKKSLNSGSYNYTDSMIELLNFKNLNSGPYGKLIHNSIFNSNLKFPKLKIYEDLLFSFELINLEQNIFFTQRTEYYYIHRPRVGAMNGFIKEPTTDVIIAISIIIEYLKTNRLIEILDKSFYSLISQIIMYIGDINKLDPNWNKKESKVYIEETQKVLSQNRMILLKEKKINKKEKIILTIFSYSKLFYKIIFRIMRIIKRGKEC